MTLPPPLPPPEHVEGGGCWCEDLMSRVMAIDRLFPDRCKIPSDLDSPNRGLALCTLPAGHEQPCASHLDRAPGPCHFCGGTYEGLPYCPFCWTDLRGMTLAEMKAVFAAGAPELSIDPVINQGES